MLLVDDDEAELLERQEQRRSGSGDDPHPPLDHLPPDLLARSRRDVRVPLRRLHPESHMEAVDEALRQGDLGQEDQHLPAGLQRLGDGLEIDLGLARSGDAFEQRREKTAGADGARQPIGGRLLLGAEIGASIGDIRLGDDRRRGEAHRLERPGFDQPVHHGGRDASRMREARPCPRRRFRGSRQNTLARPRHPLGREPGRAQGIDHRLGVEGDGRAQHHPRDEARRRQRIGGHPVDEAACRRTQRRAVEDMGDHAQLFRIDRLAAAVPDDAGHEPGPERHRDD